MRKTLKLLFISVLALQACSQEIKTDLKYLVKQPANAVSPTPVLIILHGYGSNENTAHELSNTIGEKLLCFSLKAPYNNKEGGGRWFNMKFLEYKKFRNNYRQAAESRKKILSFISQACRKYNGDSTRVYVMGFSQGAMMAYDIGINAPEKVRGVIAMSGRIMEETRNAATDWGRVQSLQVLVAHGYKDDVIIYQDALSAIEFLNQKSVKDLTVKNYDIAHLMNEQEIWEIKAWLENKAFN